MRLLTSIVHLRPQIVDTSIHTSYLIRIFKELEEGNWPNLDRSLYKSFMVRQRLIQTFVRLAVAVALRLPCQEARIIRSERGSSTGIFTVLENTLLQYRQGLLRPRFFLRQALADLIRPDNRDARELALADLKHMDLTCRNGKFPIRDALAIHAHSTGLDHAQ